MNEIFDVGPFSIKRVFDLEDLKSDNEIDVVCDYCKNNAKYDVYFMYDDIQSGSNLPLPCPVELCCEAVSFFFIDCFPSLPKFLG